MVAFSFQQRLIHRLIMQGPFLQDIGLLHGKMGIALFFFEYGKYTNCSVYTDVGEELLDDIWGQVHDELPYGFGSGLAGIGWSIEYLLQHHFIEGNGNEVCEEIDQRIMQINLTRLKDTSLETGLEGLFFYCSARMQGAEKQNNPSPFDAAYLKDLAHVNTCLAINGLSAFYRRYPISISSLLDTNLIEIDENSYLTAALGLKEGIAGFLFKQINEK